MNYDKTKLAFGALHNSFIHTLKAIAGHLNANISIKISSVPGFFDEQGEPQGTYKDVISGTANFIVYRLLLRTFWKVQTYPYNSARIKVVSLNKPVKNIEKFFTVFTFNSCIFFIITCLSLIIILKYLLEVSFTIASLECLRILTTASTLNSPFTTFRRSSFFIFIVFVFLVSSFLQSHLQAINIIPDYAPKIDSLEDLIDSNLTIHGPNYYKEVIAYEEILKKYQVQNIDECLVRLKNSEQIVCVIHEGDLYSKVNGSPFLHISKDNLIERGVGHLCTENWPLYHKFNSVLSRLFTGGLIQWYSRSDYPRLQTSQDNKNSAVKKYATIHEFIIYFYILIWGITSAVVIFILENIIYRLRKIKYFMIFNIFNHN